MKEVKRNFFLIYAEAFMISLRYFNLYLNKDIFQDIRPYESKLAGKMIEILALFKSPIAYRSLSVQA